jgi:hypothetical protein
MQPSITWVARLFVVASCCAGPAFADDKGPVRFDLICNGMMDHTTWNGHISKTFTTRFRVDLKSNAFCTEDYCGAFTQQDGPKLVYHCKAVPGQVCGADPDSTGGPFIHNDDFVIDRSSGSFHRTSSGSEGDIAPTSFSESYSGDCVISPFTGLSKSKGAPK